MSHALMEESHHVGHSHLGAVGHALGVERLPVVVLVEVRFWDTTPAEEGLVLEDIVHLPHVANEQAVAVDVGHDYLFIALWLYRCHRHRVLAHDPHDVVLPGDLLWGDEVLVKAVQHSCILDAMPCAIL